MTCPFCGQDNISMNNRTCKECGHNLDLNKFLMMAIKHMYNIVDTLVEEDIHHIGW